jgi:hypothetical protein
MKLHPLFQKFLDTQTHTYIHDIGRVLILVKVKVKCPIFPAGNEPLTTLSIGTKQVNLLLQNPSCRVVKITSLYITNNHYTLLFGISPYAFQAIRAFELD